MSSCLFSILVPVHNVRAYLRECVDSVLAQSFSDFELIAIDDASPDGSGAILDEYGAADPRVRVIHLDENVGLGLARNVGIDAATGRYLLFVDSDDTLAAGALTAISARIAAVSDPDILVFDYALTDWTGRVARDGTTSAIAAAGPEVFCIDEHPELLRLLLVVWNKAYRREWVSEHGFRFPPGYYEDAPWTYPTLLTARRIAVLDRVCYHYRQRRHGNILRSQSRKHFDAFDQYSRVFTYLDARSDLQRWRAPMFDRMTRHFVTILSQPDRVPRAMRREFFDRAAHAYREHRPAGYQPPPGRERVWWRAFERGDYRAFRAAKLANTLAARGGQRVALARRRAVKFSHRGKRVLIRLYYWYQLRKPIDDALAVYAAYWSRGYSCNPAAIYERAQRLAPHIRGVWVVRADRVAAMPPGVDYVVQDTRAYYRVMARAKYFVNNVNFPHIIIKRAGMVHVQTQHGTPLKTMGLALRDYPVAAAGMNFERLMQHADRWDYLISSNRFSTEVWERSFPNGYVTLEMGYPRNDRLVTATPADVDEVRRSLGLAASKTVVLYAPTFRDWQPTGFAPAIDLRELCERLGDDVIVLVRGHYFTTTVEEGLAKLIEQGVLRDVSAHPSVEDLLLAADVLVTDYSSVMFDYANLDRPIVIYADDWETYVQVRGVNFDLLAAPPGVVETTQGGLVDAFLSGRFRSAEARVARSEFRRRFCELDDGHAAERVVRRVFLDDRAADQS